MQNKKFRVDGNSPDMMGIYFVWRIMNDNIVVATLFGPMSFLAANAACKAMNEGMGMSEARDHYEAYSTEKET